MTSHNHPSGHAGEPSQTESFTVHCEFESQPGAYERLLRVVRVRGFQILTMTAEDQRGTVSLTLTLWGERGVSNLLDQLRKLQEVCRVESLWEEAELASA